MSYIVGHPIKYPADFYGRHWQVARFFEIIGGSQAQSISILGVRRAGKTSFLQYIAHPFVMARHLRHPQDYKMVYLDMSTCKTPIEFYQRLLHRLRATLGKAKTGFLWKESPPGEANLYDIETFLCQYPSQRIVLLLDEFDQLRIETFGPDFLTELRAMTSVLEYDLACVTASYWDLYRLGNQLGLPPTSPFYNIFYPTPIYLSGLKPDDAEALIRTPAEREGITFSADDVAQVQELAGSLPFFLQATAATWFRQKRAGHTPDPVVVLRQLAADLSPYFDQWWRHFDEGQQHILRHLAHDKPLTELSYSTFEVDSITRGLGRFGLFQEETEKIQLNGAIFGIWIRQYADLVRQNRHSQNGQRKTADPTALRHILVDHFNMEELRTLCFDLGLDFESLPGNSKPAKARELVEYWRNRRELNRLAEAIRAERGAII